MTVSVIYRRSRLSTFIYVYGDVDKCEATRCYN